MSIFQSIRIVLMSIAAAIAYGIAHDQVTVRICLEYFTIGHEPVFPTRNPTLLAIGWGIIATWWVGVLLGVPLAIVARAGSPRGVVARGHGRFCDNRRSRRLVFRESWNGGTRWANRRGSSCGSPRSFPDRSLGALGELPRGTRRRNCRVDSRVAIAITLTRLRRVRRSASDRVCE